MAKTVQLDVVQDMYGQYNIHGQRVAHGIHGQQGPNELRDKIVFAKFNGQSSSPYCTWAICMEHRKDGAVEERRENKLYVGNLDHRVTEYHVIKMFSPYGKILSEEYMWHTHGPRRGEPRGFAFVEYSKKEEAQKAKDGLDGKLAFGRPLVVRFVDERMISSERPAHGAHMLSTSATSSLHSSSQTSRSAKIIAIRNKLRAMEQEGILGSGTSKRAKTFV